jgi:hypothetical protein
MITASVTQKNHYYHNMWDANTNHMLFLTIHFIQIRQYHKFKNQKELQSHFLLMRVNLTIQARRYAQLQIMQGKTNLVPD